jgi:lysine-specific demethylase 8
VIGGRTVQVHYWPRSLEKPTGEAVLAKTQSCMLPFRKASELIRIPSEFVYFMMAKPIKQVFPELLADLDFDEVILGVPQLTSVNLWFAPAGHLTLLHYDGYDNFLNQIIGRKKITLFSPADKPYLYSPSEGGTRPPSTVNLFEPDYERFPHFGRATPIEFILEPGDTLYLPTGWSHQIESLDVTVSVNFFFGKKESPRV